MARAIITGGLGFIGHHLWHKMLQHDYQVAVIDDVRFASKELIRERHQYCNNNLWYHNSSDNLELLEELSYGYDTVVYHLASHPNQASVADDPYESATNIVAATARIAQFCKERRLKLVYVSSSMVYGNFQTDYVAEDHPCLPINMYGLYKKQAEEIVREVLPRNHVIIRPSAVYGPRDDGKRVISKWMQEARNNENLTVQNPGAMLDFTYVTDVVQGLMLAGQYDKPDTFNITAGYARSLGEAAQMIVNATDSRSRVIHTYGSNKSQPKRGALNIEHAQRNLMYQPRVMLEEGIAKLRQIQ